MYSCVVTVKVSENSVGEIMRTFASQTKPTIEFEGDCVKITADEEGREQTAYVSRENFVACTILTEAGTDE